MVSVDGSKEAIEAIRAGKLHSTSAQFPGRDRPRRRRGRLRPPGRQARPKDIKIPVKLITKANTEPPKDNGKTEGRATTNNTNSHE